ncbi:MAG: RsmE family RNA methyltransferase, partial [Nitrospinota bacterium]|nr:RsmE family RNA methyltransferase [Nitrospinota bacterium]
VERWNKISWEASKQSGRSQIPKVKPIFNSIEEFSRACEDFDLKIVFWEEEETVRLRDIELKNTPRSVAVVTGPEGGLTGAEIKVAREAGFGTVSLGSRILRAETAPIAVLSLLQNLWGDL